MGKKSRRPKAGKKGKGGGSAGGGRGGSGGKRGAPAAVSTYTADTSGFGDAPSPEAVAEFWAWFNDNDTLLRDLPHFEAERLIDEALKEVHSLLVHELESPRLDGEMKGTGELEEGKPYHLVISADGVKELFNTVLVLISAAPTNLEGWRFAAFRQRQENVGDLTVFYGGRRLSHSNIRYVLVEDGSADKIGIRCYFKDFMCKFEELEAKWQEYYGTVGLMALHAALGEYDFVMHVGEVQFLPWAFAVVDQMFESKVYPLSRLAHDFDRRLSEKIGPKPEGGWAELSGLGCKLGVRVGSASTTAGSPTSVAEEPNEIDNLWAIVSQLQHIPVAPAS